MSARAATTGRIIQASLVALALTPCSSGAIQLHWSTGETNLTVTQNTRAVLVIQADSTERALPSSWRLQWTADSSGIEPAPASGRAACLSDTANVSSVDAPATPADSLANEFTAHFCSDGEARATAAHCAVDLVGGSRGKLRVVALNPANAASVLKSNEVTVNGGIDGQYAPLILRAGRTHPSSELRVKAVGVGLAGNSAVQIAARDTSWRLALHVVSRTDTTLEATARVAADLPPFVLQVGGAEMGDVAVVALDADTATVLSVQPACTDYMKEINLDSHQHIQPYDFAFVASRDSFHIFYTRRDTFLTFGETSKIIGHKRSRNLNDWVPTENTMTAIHVRDGYWDNAHVWAPTIIKKPNDITYYMLYTGVDHDAEGHEFQRIGVATSTDLNIWDQDATWIYEPKNTSWAEPDSLQPSGQQFRDPFVMAAPDSAGTYLMYFVAGSHARKPRLVVGVARSYGDLRNWRDVGPLWNTDFAHSGASIVESPHAFKDPGGRWSLYYSSQNPGSPNDSNFVVFQTNDLSPFNEDAGDTLHWSAPDTLYKDIGGDQTLQFWHGSEYLKVRDGYEYLAAYDDREEGIVISEISWHDAHTFELNDSCPPAVPLGVDPLKGGLEPSLDLLGARPSRAPVEFEVVAPSRTRVRLAIYDVLGRRVQTLLDEEMALGRREVRWDGLGVSGEAVGSGVYFARLTTRWGQRVARIVLLR